MITCGKKRRGRGRGYFTAWGRREGERFLTGKNRKRREKQRNT